MQVEFSSSMIEPFLHMLWTIGNLRGRGGRKACRRRKGGVG